MKSVVSSTSMSHKRSQSSQFASTSIPSLTTMTFGKEKPTQKEDQFNYEKTLEVSDEETNETSRLLYAVSPDDKHVSHEETTPLLGRRRQRSSQHGHKRSMSFAETVNYLTLTWHKIGVYARIRANGSCGTTYKTGEIRHLLNNVSGIARPGNVLAIMGPSGSGKSVLLSLLAGRRVGNIALEGEVKLNGQLITKSIKALSAYVQQEDVFIGTMKVEEHLWFQAQLRMDSHISMKDRILRIQEVMTEMGLKKCAKTHIGVPGSMKGISGGEMKRLSLASEILTNPPLLICDEPTSGLDAFMAENVIQNLKSMAKKGKTVILTINQPSSEVFNTFDDLMLLTEGRLAYFGSTKDSLEFFNTCGYPCPVTHNPADHFLNCLAILPEEEANSRERATSFTRKFNESENYGKLVENIQVLETTKDLDLLQKIEQQELLKKSPYKASWCQQLWAVTWRCFLSQMRNFNISVICILQNVFVAALIGMLFFRQELNERGVMNINGALFFFIGNVSFMNALMVCNAFPSELKIFRRDHHNGMYGVGAYFIAKNLAEFLLFIVLPTIFVGLNYWLVGLKPGAVPFFICWITLVLVCKTSVSFGYFLSTVVGNMDLCLALSIPILQAVMFYAGYMVNLSTMPPWMSWLQYLSWYRYAYELLMVNQWSGYDSLPCSSNSSVSTQAAPCFHDGESILAYYGFQNANYFLDFCGMVFLMITLRIGAYIALSWRAKE